MPLEGFFEKKLGEVMTSFEAEPLTAVTSLAQEKAWKETPSGQRKGIDFDEVSLTFKKTKNDFGVGDAEELRDVTEQT